MNGENNSKDSIVNRIIQGGAVGLALVALVGLIYVVSNHISHNTDVLGELNISINKLNSTIENYSAAQVQQANAFETLEDAVGSLENLILRIQLTSK